jgi:hypothetical protein
MFNNTTDVKKDNKALKGEVLETAKHTGEKIRHLYDGAHNEFNHVRNAVANRINHKPVQSAAIAMACLLYTSDAADDM